MDATRGASDLTGRARRHFGTIEASGRGLLVHWLTASAPRPGDLGRLAEKGAGAGKDADAPVAIAHELLAPPKDARPSGHGKLGGEAGTRTLKEFYVSKSGNAFPLSKRR